MSREDRYKEGVLRACLGHIVPPEECEAHGIWNYGEPESERDPLEDEHKRPLATLPHQCSEWTIGGPDDAKALIRDLERFVEECEIRL